MSCRVQLAGVATRFASCAMVLLGSVCSDAAAEASATKPPGVVVAHVPAASKSYVGSPSIAVLPSGTYVASHDYFGPGSSNNRTAVFSSSNRGIGWTKLTEVSGQWWSTLFVHSGQLYLIGTSKQFGAVVIRRSADSGRTWTSPRETSSGLLTTSEGFHCAPVPVIMHNGRVWRAMEEVRSRSSKGFRALMFSAPVEADLLNASSWTLSNMLPGDANWLGGKYGGWLEGNAVATPNGELVDVLRVRFTSTPEKAAFVRVSADGRTATFNPVRDFVDFPGGSKKFTIRFDPVSRLYWTLANIVPKNATGTDHIRNTLALVSSPDLRKWTVRSVVLHHSDRAKHAFQYVDWLFDVDDIIAVSRTAYEDDAEGAHSAHDANYLTFHRVPHFRELKSSAVDASLQAVHQTGDFALAGSDFAISKLADGQTAFANRKYVWQQVPAKFKGWSFTRIAGGERVQIRVRAKRAAVLHIATTLMAPGVNLAGWQREGSVFSYNDSKRTQMVVFQRRLAAGQEIEVPQGNWTGAMVLVRD